VDAVATHDAESGSSAIFLVNRSLDEEVEIVVDVSLLGTVALESAESLHDTDMHATNSLAEPERVTLKPNTTARLEGGELRLVLPPVSWSVVTLR
jgi:alpha-N-arabinofuranosidase